MPGTEAKDNMLATAVKLAEDGRVMLDHDFVIFKDEIKGRLGVEVVSGYMQARVCRTLQGRWRWPEHRG